MDDLYRVKDPCALLKRSISIWIERPSQNQGLVTWQVSNKQYVKLKKEGKKQEVKQKIWAKIFKLGCCLFVCTSE